ncbi:MAG: helix-turn-helix domain-containing protein [Gemmatimonadota bacterium]|jgi:AraC-like DNA-binding protein|nr:helix-turn-helix domain-containing protein [Gemmatimonadota bacterium]
MQKVPRPLIVLHGDETLQAGLRAVASSQKLELHFFNSWDELDSGVPQTPASALFVVDPWFATDGTSGPSMELASLLERFPSLTVTAATTVGPERVADLLLLASWGVVQIIDLQEELTPLALGRRLTAARGRPLRALVEGALPEYTSASGRAILNAAFTIVADGDQGSDLARVLGITERTLSRWCRKAALPPPKRLLAWMRVLLAAEFLDDPGRPVAAVAQACGYSADSSLRLALRRFAGANPTELRDMGAFDTAASAFVEALSEARGSKRRYRAPSRQRLRSASYTSEAAD